MALEENDFSGWPTRIYARSWIRQYAKRVGLDPEELVNEFCRLFQHGDRRTETLMRECAVVLGHQLDWRQELLPAHSEGDRRSDSRRADVAPRVGSNARFIQKVPQ